MASAMLQAPAAAGLRSKHAAHCSAPGVTGCPASSMPARRKVLGSPAHLAGALPKLSKTVCLATAALRALCAVRCCERCTVPWEPGLCYTLECVHCTVPGAWLVPGAWCHVTAAAQQCLCLAQASRCPCASAHPLPRRAPAAGARSLCRPTCSGA